MNIPPEEKYLRLKALDKSDLEDINFTDFSKGINVIPEENQASQKSITTHTGDFVKWVKNHDPEVCIDMPEHDTKVELRSIEFWLPLVFLGSDVTLPMYLNMVSNYLYDKLRGSLSNDRNTVSLSAISENTESGTFKKFEFKGDAKTFQKKFKTIDMNKFYDE